jgi:hypothetical protein
LRAPFDPHAADGYSITVVGHGGKMKAIIKMQRQIARKNLNRRHPGIAVALILL